MWILRGEERALDAVSYNERTEEVDGTEPATAAKKKAVSAAGERMN
jgi:hypothetical protein